MPAAELPNGEVPVAEVEEPVAALDEPLTPPVAPAEALGAAAFELPVEVREETPPPVPKLTVPTAN